jgi:hypothetical protein
MRVVRRAGCPLKIHIRQIGTPSGLKKPDILSRSIIIDDAGIHTAKSFCKIFCLSLRPRFGFACDVPAVRQLYRRNGRVVARTNFAHSEGAQNFPATPQGTGRGSSGYKVIFQKGHCTRTKKPKRGRLFESRNAIYISDLSICRLIILLYLHLSRKQDNGTAHYASFYYSRQ